MKNVTIELTKHLACRFYLVCMDMFGSRPPEVFLGKGVLKICIKFTGEHPC